MEKVASIKVYFETYYNDARFGNVSPRSLRHRRTLAALNDTQCHPRELAQVQRDFFRAESDHLREYRSLISKHCCEKRTLGLAGYEAIRVLGKGSFGVVRLVRETRGDQSNRNKVCEYHVCLDVSIRRGD